MGRWSNTFKDLFTFDPADGTKLNSHSVAGGYLRGFDLSADGSTLDLHENGTNVHIIDVATLAEVFSTTTSGSFDGHCISGDQWRARHLCWRQRTQERHVYRDVQNRDANGSQNQDPRQRPAGLPNLLGHFYCVVPPIVGE